jgi:bisphosphoglycerate-independent phosphoglycerate mutase (AlkP superfamily)
VHSFLYHSNFFTENYSPYEEGIEICFYKEGKFIAKVLYRPHELKNQTGELWIDQEIQNLSKIAETKNKITELKEQIKKLEETL